MTWLVLIPLAAVLPMGGTGIACATTRPVWPCRRGRTSSGLAVFALNLGSREDMASTTSSHRVRCIDALPATGSGQVLRRNWH